MAIKEIEFNLSEKISYHHKGEAKETKLLILKSPANNQRRTVLKLQQLIMRALIEAGDKSLQTTSKKTKKDVSVSVDEEISGGVITALLMGSKSLDINDVEEGFEELMTSGSCLIGGEEPMNSTLYDKLPCEDLIPLMGEYSSSFLLEALLSHVKKS